MYNTEFSRKTEQTKCMCVNVCVCTHSFYQFCSFRERVCVCVCVLLEWLTGCGLSSLTIAVPREAKGQGSDNCSDVGCFSVCYEYHWLIKKPLGQ